MDAVVDSIELVKLEEALVARLVEVEGASTDIVVSWPLTVVAINPTEGIEVALVVPTQCELCYNWIQSWEDAIYPPAA